MSTTDPQIHTKVTTSSGRPSAEGDPPPEWAMRNYILALLFTGPTPEPDKEKRKELIRGHLANSARMHEAGKLILAGPFVDDTDLAGMWVFDSDSVEEVKKLVAGDPAVTRGLFRVEYHPWYSAKGIGIARPDVEDPPA